MKNNAFRSISFAVICMILGILIALQMKNVNTMNLSEKNLDELQNKLLEYAAKNEALNNRNLELEEYTRQLEEGMASDNEQISAIVKEKERAAIFAGLREVTGYGIMITVSCAEGINVKDSVLSYMINELKSIGAQAIAVNDERIIAMSEIRSVESASAIIINGNSYSSQGVFEIKAITDPKKEENTLYYIGLVRDQILKNSQFADDLYDIKFSAVQEMTVPALSEDSTAFKINLLMPEA